MKAKVWPSYLCVVFVFICPSVLLKSRNMWPLHAWVINLPLSLMKPHLCSQFTLIWFISHSYLLKCWCVLKTCSISEESDLLLTVIVLCKTGVHMFLAWYYGATLKNETWPHPAVMWCDMSNFYLLTYRKTLQLCISSFQNLAWSPWNIRIP